MPVFFFLFNFFAFIADNSRKMVNIGELHFGCPEDRTQVRTQKKKLNLPPCLRPPNNGAKGNLRVHTGCKEKHAARAKFVVFHLLIGLIAVAVTVAFVVALRIYRCA